MIIEEWIEKELGEVLTLNYGWSLPEKKRVPGDFPVYGSNGIVGSHNEALVPTGGLVVGRKGSAGNVHFARRPFCPIDTTFYVAPSDTSIDLEFLYFLLLHVDLKRILGDVGVPGLNREMAYRERAKFPSDRVEQRKIASVLGAAQRAVEQQERLITLTAELKMVLVHQLFTHGLRGKVQKQTEIGPVPQSWCVTRLDEFCVLQRGFDIIKKDQVAGDVPVVSSGGIASYHNVAKVKGPGVIVGRKGTLGKVHYIEGDYWPHDTTLWVKDFKGNDPMFTSYFLKTLRFERYNSGASNPTLNRNTVHTELVAYPKLAEQQEIGRILRVVDDKAQVHERKRDSINDLFRTLLHQLMTAQIRVHDLEFPISESAIAA
jgi:type I restriction enzyme, S subunit